MTDETTEHLTRVVVGDPFERREITVVDYDPEWPQRFDAEAGKIRTALTDRAVRIEHIGSTAVPGLAAKPIIDILLVVEDSSNEPAYVPALEGVGYELRVREPDFDEHRMLRTPGRDVHIHVFSPGSKEVERYLVLRDHLRRSEDDLQRYAGLKRELADRSWPTMQHYSDAKSDLIEAIISRATDGSGAD